LTVEVGKYGRIVLPKKLRQKYGINEGIRLIITEYMGHICLVPVKTHEKPTEALYGSVKPEKPVDKPKHLAREHIRKKLTEGIK
jgi:AbrB family looped-hinge helix DNA binding protein